MTDNYDLKLIEITQSITTGEYNVSLSQGMSINEAAFCTMVMIRCFKGSKLIKDEAEFIQLINKYIEDERFQEHYVKNKEDKNE